MIKIAICDDQQTYLHDLRRLLLEYSQSCGLAYFDIQTFSHPLDLLKKIINGVSYDMFLFDIYMPDMTGIVLAEELRERNVEAPIIFLTTSRDHALEAFGVGAMQYLLKPFDKKELFFAMTSAMEKLQRDRRRSILLQCEGGLQRISIREIIYAETSGNYQKLHMTEDTFVRLRMTSSELYDQLAPFMCFARCGIAYVLNLAQIKRLEQKHVMLSNEVSIPIPRGAYKDLKNKYFEFYSREEV